MSYYQRTPEAEEIAKRFKEIQQPQTVPQKPADTGFVKPGGWGADRNPNNWKPPVKMRDDPKLWKIVDTKNKNVATNFITKEGAQTFIDVARKLWVEDGDTDPAPEEPGPTPPPTTGQLGPYAAIGADIQTTKKRGIRHYASGKPDDQTIERNARGIKARNHQFITYVTMNKIDHDDTMSQKIGGTHMGTGWFDNTISFKAGQTGLGTEKKHPDADLELIKGPKIGSILNKKVGMCCAYFADKNLVQLFANTGSGWKKMCEGTNVGGFNPKAKEFECQLRIDGFTDGSDPTIHTAVVQEIAAQ